MNKWDSSIIQKIYLEKEREKSKDRDNLLRLTSEKLYGEKIHYVLELIQNAEDEGSSSIIFVFNENNVAIINDGKTFDEDDVWGICSVRTGRKKNKVGFFGIGFKSVFNVTEKPQIISSKFNFEIRDYIYPKPKTSIPKNFKTYYSPKRGAIFILPYSSGLSTSEDLIKNLNSLDDKILLFLESLEKLKFIDNISNIEWEIKKNLEGNSILHLIETRYLFNWDSSSENENNRFLRFLADNLNITWVENANVNKTDDGKTINIFADEKSIEITLDASKEKALLKINDGRTYNLQVKEDNNRLNIWNERETKWKVFHHNIHVDDEKIIPEGKEGLKKTQITIAFPLDDSIRETIKKNGVVYCYLPTKKITNLPFLIQADFLPTIGRENISDHPWNKWLLKELGNLAANAIDEIKNDEQLSHFLYDFIPLSDEIHDTLIKEHLYNSFFESLKEKKIAKTSKGWVKPIKCAIPNNEMLRDILSESDFKLFFSNEIYYIDSGLTENDSFTRAENVLFELGAKKIEEKFVLGFLIYEKNVIRKSKEWFLNLYDYLSSIFDTTKKSHQIDYSWEWDEETKMLFGLLEKIKFILTDDEKLVPLKDSDMPDRLICYPQNIDLSEVHQLFTDGEIVFLHRFFQESSIVHRKEDAIEIENKRKGVKDWFDSIGVKKYIKQAHIIKDIVLPKFTTGKYLEYDDAKLYKLLDYIRINWPTIESEIQNKKLSSDIIHEIKSSVLVKTISYKNGKKANEYKKPEEIYFSKSYGKNEKMEDLFEGIENISYLSTYYLNREKKDIRKKKRGRQKEEYSWRKFFELLGVWISPRVIKEENWISISGKESYSWVKKNYSPYGLHEIYGDSYSRDIEKLIEHCSKMDNKTEIQKRMTILWECLEKNWKSYKDKGIHNSTYRYAYYQRLGEYYFNKVDFATSSFLELLRNASWVPEKVEGFCMPRGVFIDTKKNRFLLGSTVKYTDLKANETFLKDLGVRIEPELEEIIEHLKTYRDSNPYPKESKIEKMKEIYYFLQWKIEGIEDLSIRDRKMQEIKDMINEFELIYLPREDKSWWKPSHVFWRDFSDRFETLRGYIENNGSPIYDVGLKSFLLSLGVIEKPLLKESLEVIWDLKANGDFDNYKKFTPKIYYYIDELIRQDMMEGIDWNRDIFLSEKGQFLSPSGPDFYYNDDEDYKNYFMANVEILWLPFSWVNIKNVLQSANFKRLSQNVSVIKKFGELDEIEGEATYQLIKRLSCVENYLKRKNVELYGDLQMEGVFKKIKEIEAYAGPKIILDYLLKKDNSETIVISNVEKEAYFSSEENRIYISSQTDLLSTNVAKKLSELFTRGENDVFPFLDSLFAAKGEEELNEKLRLFGIHIMDISTEEPYAGIKLITSGGEGGQEAEIKNKEKELKPPEKFKKPQIPGSDSGVERSDLIDPNEYIFDTIDELIPYQKIDGMPNVPIKTVKLIDGNKGGQERNLNLKTRALRIDAEDIALEIVMRFEEIVGRDPDDRHKQRKIGYDIYSTNKNGDERFIEVKHFRGETGIWEFDSYQWEKALQEKDKFFVYVVSGLKKDYDPTIEIIQNPVKYLAPDPPIQKKFSSWKNGVVKVIKCQKV